MRDDLDELFQRARNLDAAGSELEAQRAYVAVLDVDPRHFGALTNLAAMLERRGLSAAALQGYREVVQAHPGNAIGYVNLGAALYDAGDIEEARECYESALRIDQERAEAHQGLAAIFARLGDDVAARHHRRLGFRERAIVRAPYRGTGNAPRVLLLLSTLGGNVDLRQFLDESRCAVWKVFVDALDTDIELPPHDVVVNAIGDADLCGDVLREADALLQRTNAPVLNHPRAVLATGRLANARRLSGIPGIVVPRIQSVPRQDVTQLANGRTAFPLLLRATGYHTGEHFVRVDDAAHLAGAAAKLPTSDLLAMEYIDTRSPDGVFRKYRVMLVDGKLYPLHLAISSNWMVHYFSGQTLDDAAHRAEEQRFLDDMSATIGAEAVGALEAVGRILALDYGGIDFTFHRNGNVVVFEANATMTIPRLAQAPDDYRRPALARLCAAVGDLQRRQSLHRR